MDEKKIEIGIILCLIVCGRDGILAGDELEVIYDEFLLIDNSLERDFFEKVIDQYFDEIPTITSQAAKLNDKNDQEHILRIAEKSAAADGLAEMENIALQKLKSEWGLNG